MFRFLLRSVFKMSRHAAPSSAVVKTRPVAVQVAPRQVASKLEVTRSAMPASLKGKCHVIDGDTIVISGTKIRIAGIDAPELDQPCGKNSKFALIALCKGRQVEAVLQPEISYDRIVAKCILEDGTDLAAELVKQGLALDWPRFSGGAYRHLEPEGARDKLWRCAAKHQGRLKSVERNTVPKGQ